MAGNLARHIVFQWGFVREKSQRQQAIADRTWPNPLWRASPSTAATTIKYLYAERPVQGWPPTSSCQISTWPPAAWTTGALRSSRMGSPYTMARNWPWTQHWSPRWPAPADPALLAVPPPPPLPSKPLDEPKNARTQSSCRAIAAAWLSWPWKSAGDGATRPLPSSVSSPRLVAAPPPKPCARLPPKRTWHAGRPFWPTLRKRPSRPASSCKTPRHKPVPRVSHPPSASCWNTPPIPPRRPASRPAPDPATSRDNRAGKRREEKKKNTLTLNLHPFGRRAWWNKFHIFLITFWHNKTHKNHQSTVAKDQCFQLQFASCQVGGNVRKTKCDKEN